MAQVGLLDIQHSGFGNHIEALTFFERDVVDSFNEASKIMAKELGSWAKAGMVKDTASIKRSKQGNLYYTSKNNGRHLRILTGTLYNALDSLSKGRNQRGAIFKRERQTYQLKATFGINVKGKDGRNYALEHDRDSSKFKFFKISFLILRDSFAINQNTLLLEKTKRRIKNNGK